MARAIRKTSLSIGMVTIPVGLYKMEETSKTSLARLCECGSKPTNNITCSDCGAEYGRSWVSLPNQGMKVGKDSYLVISAEEIKEAEAAIAKYDVMEHEKAVDYKELSTKYVVKPAFYVLPDEKAPAAALKAYRLIVEVLAEKGWTSLTRLSIRSNKRIALIANAENNRLVAAVVEDAREQPFMPESVKVSQEEKKLVTQLLKSSFDKDVTFEADPDPVRELLESKSAEALMGKPSKKSTKKSKKESTLVAQLEASLEAK